MKTIAISLFLAGILLSCQQGSSLPNSSTKTEAKPTTAPPVKQESKNPATNQNKSITSITFACYDCFGGLQGSWYQVDYDMETLTISSMWYWDSENESKKALKILEQKSDEGGEISATTGKIQFPLSGDIYDFVIIENRLTISAGDVSYDYEQE